MTNRNRWARAGRAFWLALLALAVVTVAATRNLAPGLQLALAGVGCGTAVATAAGGLVWVIIHREELCGR